MTGRFVKICALLLCGVFTAAMFAQNSNSTITGTVQDISGAVVPGATVKLTNVNTGQQLTTTSQGNGSYVFTNLNPANYQVAVSAPGFADWVGVLTLRVSQAAEVNARLTAGSVSTQVTVRDVTPVIDRVDSTISDVKNATTIETLPVQNRNILNVLAFSPGVVAGNYGGTGSYTRVNGVPGGSMAYLVDGQTMANRFSGELQTNPQPIPTFQEVKVIAANGDAQYGRPGVIEMVTKSGTNHFHGQLFELNQNNYLRAKQFNSGPTVNYLMHNEFGGQIGGPVWLPKLYNGRNKTFFFVDLEGIREDGNAPVRYIVPTAAMRGGGDLPGADLSALVDPNDNPITVYDPEATSLAGPPFARTPFASNFIPANRLNPVSQKILNTYLPLPNIPSAPFYNGTPNYQPTNSPETLRNKLYTAKVDQLFGPNRLAMRYTYTDASTLRPGPYYILNPEVTQSGGDNGAVVFTQVVGTHAVNVVRAGVQYDHNFTGPQPISPPITQALGLPTYTDTVAWPSFYWNYGFDSYWSGIDRGNPEDFPDQTITAGDQFSYNRSNHQLMFGFDINNYRLTTYEIGQPGGGYTFSGNFTALQDPTAVATGTYDQASPDTGAGLADFLLGDTDLVNLNIYPVYHTRQTEFDGYAQDNWRPTPKLTLNLGLRYTYWTAFTDASGLTSAFDPNASSGCSATLLPGQLCGMIVYQGSGTLPAQTSMAVFNSFKAAGLPIESAAQADYPLSLWNMPKNNLQPRLGFAYQLDSKTVLRGGWGIYQWVMPLQQYQAAARKNPPFSYSLNLSPGEIDGVFTDSAAAELEFPNATAQYGGPQPLNQFMLGNNSTLILNTTGTNFIQQGYGFNLIPMDSLHYKAQTVQEYNLTFARELPAHLGFQLSYIGNHSTNLPQEDLINYLIPRELCPSEGRPADCAPSQRRTYPVFTTSATYNMAEYRFDGYSNTNELQTRLQHTFGNGLLLQSYFTWQRTLTTTEDTVGPGGVGTGALNVLPSALTNNAPYSQRQRAIYAPDSNIPDKTFSFNAHYAFPFGRGKKFLGNSHGIVNGLVSGWNISPFFLWHSGFHFAPYYNDGQSSNIVLAPGKTGILPEGQRTPQRWFDASVDDQSIGQPYTGQTFIIRANPLDDDLLSNIPRNYMTGPGFNELDTTIYKLTPITKGSMLDIEAQIFNVYNHQNLALPNNQGIITAPVGASSIEATSLPGSLPRMIQLQAKFIF